MHDWTVVAVFCGALLFLFLLYQYVTLSTPLTDESSDVLLNVATHPSRIRGVDNQERLFCPRQARSRLLQLLRQKGQRGIIYRDPSEAGWRSATGTRYRWLVVTGPKLSVTEDANHDQRMLVYFMRQGSPEITSAAGNAPRETPAELIDWQAQYHSAINMDAVVVKDGQMNISRFENVAEALKAVPKEDNVGEQTLVMTNGNHDRSVYVVRVRKDAGNPVITGASLPGVVYVRSSPVTVPRNASV